jgi:hypothetical protein
MSVCSGIRLAIGPFRAFEGTHLREAPINRLGVVLGCLVFRLEVCREAQPDLTCRVIRSSLVVDDVGMVEPDGFLGHVKMRVVPPNSESRCATHLSRYSRMTSIS